MTNPAATAKQSPLVRMATRTDLPSADYLRTLFSYDPESGLLTRLVGRGHIPAGAVVNNLRDGYVTVEVNGRDLFVHRIAWAMHTGAWPVGEIDHKDGNPSNNRIANLRDVDRRTNVQNQRRTWRAPRSGYTGVIVRPWGFEARIGVDGHTRYLGSFPTPEQAHAAYRAAKLKFHPGFVPAAA